MLARAAGAAAVQCTAVHCMTYCTVWCGGAFALLLKYTTTVQVFIYLVNYVRKRKKAYYILARCFLYKSL